MSVNAFLKYISTQYNPDVAPSEQISPLTARLIYSLNECISEQADKHQPLQLPSISKLCEKAKCSRTSFYFHYDSVQDLIVFFFSHILEYDKHIFLLLFNSNSEELFRIAVFRELRLALFIPDLVIYYFLNTPIELSEIYSQFSQLINQLKVDTPSFYRAISLIKGQYFLFMDSFERLKKDKSEKAVQAEVENFVKYYLG